MVTTDRKKQPPETTSTGTLISAEEFSRLTGLNIKTVYLGAQRNELPHVRAGRRLLFYPPTAPTPAEAPSLSALRRLRAEQFLELLAQQPGGRLALDGLGYALAATAGLSAAAADQAVDDAGGRVSVTRDGATIVIALVGGLGGTR
jgi:hypothetical protein